MNKLTSSPATVALGASLLSAPAQAETKFITIGTGGVTSVYYARRRRDLPPHEQGPAKHGIRCSVRSTGSVPNIKHHQGGELDFGVAQSTPSSTRSGASASSGCRCDGRAARWSFSITPSRSWCWPETGVTKIEDFRASTSTSATPAPGTPATMDRLMAALGMEDVGLLAGLELKADRHGAALCDNRSDSFACVVSNPSANIQDPTTTCGAKLVNVTGPVVDKLVKGIRTTRWPPLPGGTCANNPDRSRPGVVASFVTSARSPTTSSIPGQAVFDNFDDFKLHPAFASLEPKDMIKAGLSAPLHDGAVKVLQGKGLDVSGSRRHTAPGDPPGEPQRRLTATTSAAAGSRRTGPCKLNAPLDDDQGGHGRLASPLAQRQCRAGDHMAGEPACEHRPSLLYSSTERQPASPPPGRKSKLTTCARPLTAPGSPSCSITKSKASSLRGGVDTQTAKPSSDRSCNCARSPARSNQEPRLAPPAR